MLTERVNSEVKLPRSKVIVDADRELIRQMLNNLISNAIKFTPEGGRVTVVLEEEASAARIVIQDTGRGIPEDQLEKIFERFHQVDASDKYISDTEPPGPVWFRNLLGLDFLADVAAVHFPKANDADLEHLEEMTSLKYLGFMRAQVTDAGLEHLKGLTNLKQLNLVHTQVTDAGLVHLKGLTNLKELLSSS